MMGKIRQRGTWFLGVVAIAAIVSQASAHPDPHQPGTAAVARPSAVSAAVAVTPAGTVDAFHAALARGDTVGALDLLAEDVLIFESGGIERSRAEYASHHLGADAEFAAAVTRTPVSRSHGEQGDAAWVTSVETVKGTFRGRAIDSRSVETMLLRRTAGRWRIQHIHWSSANLTPRS